MLTGSYTKFMFYTLFTRRDCSDGDIVPFNGTPVILCINFIGIGIGVGAK